MAFGRLRGTFALPALLAASVLAAPGSAAADDLTCTYNPSDRTVTAVIGPPDDSPDFAPSLHVTLSGEIRVSDSDPGDSMLCGGSVTDTDTVRIIPSNDAHQVGLVYIANPPAFAPGFTDEPGDSDEIEFEVEVGRISLSYFHGDVRAHVTLGGMAINANAGDEIGEEDADIMFQNVTHVGFTLSDQPDAILAGGGGGTPPTPFAGDLTVSGGPEDAADLLVGGDGDDWLFGGGGNDVVLGGAGDDHLEGGDGDDLVEGGPGADNIDPGPGDDRVDAGPGKDLVSQSGHEGDDVWLGGPGRDYLSGGKGGETLKGGGGPDRINGGGGNDVLNGGAGRDTLAGGVGKDKLVGRSGNDELKGRKGNDLLNGGGGRDSCRGGPGKDRFRRCEIVRP